VRQAYRQGERGRHRERVKVRVREKGIIKHQRNRYK